MTTEAILRLLNDPVLPFYPLDIALDVQNKLKGTSQDYFILFLKCNFKLYFFKVAKKNQLVVLIYANLG